MKKLPFSLGVGLSSLVLLASALPGFDILVAFPLWVLLLLVLLATGVLQKPGLKDLVLVPAVLVGIMLLFLIIFGVSVGRVDFITLLIAGVITDVALTLLVTLEIFSPIVGNIISSFVGYAIPNAIIGGPAGAILGAVASVIGLLPLHIPGIVTLTFVITKLLVEGVI